MFYFDPDLGRMNNTQRAPSAGGSRRRRWEVKSKEAFETSLAVEIQSPQTRRLRSKDSKETESPKDKKNINNSHGEHPTPPKPHKPKRGKDSHDGDPLSSKISALIDEAKAKDLVKKSVKDKQQHKEKSESSTEEEHDISRIKEKFKDANSKSQSLNDKFETKSLKVVDSPRLKHGTESPAHMASAHMASAPPLSPEETPQKKKRKKKSELLLMSNTNEESYITIQLKELEDDILEMSEKDKECVLSAPNLLFASNGHVNAVYREKLSGFVMTKNEGDGVQKKSEDLHDVTKTPTLSSHAIFIQGGFRTFSVLCQGLLAGLTLAHCLLIFLLDSDPSKIPSLYPSSMAHTFFTLILFLTTICLVAACDRCDIVGIGVLSGHGIKIPWTVAFYVTSLVMSLVAIRTENVLINVSIIQSSAFSEVELTELVDWWRWICVARSTLAVLAWLAVVPDPHTDALLGSIQEFHQK